MIADIDTFVQDMITVPTAGGAEAFVDAADIAGVAVETLVDPDAHASAVYAPTGPEALTVAEVADIIADVVGRPVRHNDIDSGVWIDGAIAALATQRPTPSSRQYSGESRAGPISR